MSTKDQPSESKEASPQRPASVEEGQTLRQDVLHSAIKKADRRILPIIYITYTVMRIDLGNAGNAAIMNLEQGTNIKQQLHINPKQWAWVLSSFYYAYMFIEPVSTLAMKYTTPRSWITRICFTWGVLTACIAAAKSYHSLVALRVLVGAAEGGFFPCVVYHWAAWYTPAELVPRVYGLYISNAMANFLSGFFAWAVSFANSQKLAGWQVLYIIEGVVPVALAPIVYYILPNWPGDGDWLTAEEVNAITSHLHRDAPRKEGKGVSWTQTKQLLSDPTFWCFTLTWCLLAVGGWGLAPVLPQIIKDLGVADSAGSNLLQMPPAFTTVTFCAIAILLTRRFRITPFAIAATLQCCIIVGYAFLITLPEAGARYVGACLVTGGSTTMYAVLWPKRVEALRGTAASGLGIGIHNALSQFSGIVGPQLFRSSFGPRYITSFKIAEGLIAASVPVVLTIWWLMEGNIGAVPGLKKIVQAQSQHAERRGLEAGERVAVVDGDQRIVRDDARADESSGTNSRDGAEEIDEKKEPV